MVVRLKVIENAMRFSFLLFVQPLLLNSDLLLDQEMTRLKEMTLNNGNEVANFVS